MPGVANQISFSLPIPPSDNARLTISHTQHRIILSQVARDFLELAKMELLVKWPRKITLCPSYTHQLHIVVTAYVKDWRGDCSNYTKMLKDAMTGMVYDDDKFVHIDYRDSIKDPENPRLEITVPLDPLNIESNGHQTS